MLTPCQPQSLLDVNAQSLLDVNAQSLLDVNALSTAVAISAGARGQEKNGQKENNSLMELIRLLQKLSLKAQD